MTGEGPAENGGKRFSVHQGLELTGGAVRNGSCCIAHASGVRPRSETSRSDESRGQRAACCTDSGQDGSRGRRPEGRAAAKASGPVGVLPARTIQRLRTRAPSRPFPRQLTLPVLSLAKALFAVPSFVHSFIHPAPQAPPLVSALPGGVSVCRRSPSSLS